MKYKYSCQGKETQHKIFRIHQTYTEVINYNKKLVEMVLDFRWSIKFYIIDYNQNITSVKF